MSFPDCNAQDIDLFICCESEEEGIDLLRKTLGLNGREVGF